MSLRLTVALGIVLGSALLALVSTFLPFTHFPDETRAFPQPDGAFTINAWKLNPLPDAERFWGALSLMPALFIVAVLVLALIQLADTKRPKRVIGFNLAQFTAVLALNAFVLMVANWTIELPKFCDRTCVEYARGTGFWLMLVGTVGMSIGAIMNMTGRASRTLLPQHAVQGTPLPPPTAPTSM